MKRRTSCSIAIRIAELKRLIVYWRERGDRMAREQIEIQIAFWKARARFGS